MNLLIDAFEALDRATTSADLRAEMEKFAKEMEFEHFAYGLTISAPSLKPQQYVINGFPQKWMERYLAHSYFKNDPLVRHAENSTLPALWDQRTFREAGSTEFFEEARSFGLEAGLCFAVHEQPGVTGIFSLVRDQRLDSDQQKLAALIGRAQIFSSCLQHAVARLVLPELLPEGTVTLTAREQECLRWAADGKTAWEIGKILNIAERTVVFHLNNVVLKLNASNRTQAIVRAVALKLI